jgi:hypothetical protein
MCHKNLDKIKIYSRNWKILNPEYEIKLYDDNMCRDFLLKEYSKLHLAIFDFIKDGPIKCDFWRACIINKYGGLYVDADINPLVPLNEYIEDDDDFCTCISHNFNRNKLEFQLNPHFILSNKDNPILQKCIDKYIVLFMFNKKNYHYWKWSVCKLLVMEGINEKKSQVLYLSNQKCKFLLEEPSCNDCSYNGKVVLKNRYDEYKNHNFISTDNNIKEVQKQNAQKQNTQKQKILYNYLLRLLIRKKIYLYKLRLRRKRFRS